MRHPLRAFLQHQLDQLALFRREVRVGAVDRTAVHRDVVVESVRHTARGVPDGFHYDITVDGRTVHCADPHLTPEQRELIQLVLKEGA